MEILYKAHSGMRWLVAAAVVIALIKLAVTWLRGGAFTGADRKLTAIAVGAIDLQVLLGLILLFFMDGQFPRFRIEHAVTMVLAAAAAHMTARWKKSEDTVRARNSYVALLVAALLIVVGVMRLPGGWMRGM